MITQDDKMIKSMLTNLIGNAIVQAGRAIKVHNIKLFSDNNFNITPEQFMVLNALCEHENLCQRELCDILLKDKSNMARILFILDKKGLIRKIKTKDKKLVNKIQITPNGRKIRDIISPVIYLSRKEYLKDINEDDLYVCLKVLSKIKSNLEEK